MAILNIFKKEEAEKTSKSKKTESSSKPFFGNAFKVIKNPRITEKAAYLSESDQYVFEVFKSSNKTEIKKAISDLYKVDPIMVRIINVPRKEKRVGRKIGFQPGYKKAIVRLKKGQKIEVLPR